MTKLILAALLLTACGPAFTAEECSNEKGINAAPTCGDSGALASAGTDQLQGVPEGGAGGSSGLPNSLAGANSGGNPAMAGGPAMGTGGEAGKQSSPPRDCLTNYRTDSCGSACTGAAPIYQAGCVTILQCMIDKNESAETCARSLDPSYEFAYAATQEANQVLAACCQKGNRL